MSAHDRRPVIGISCGDTNGIGLELIIKTFAENRMLDICTPVIFASGKALNFYKKTLTDLNLNFGQIKELDKINHKQVNVFNCWEEDVAIVPGQLTEVGGKCAVLSLTRATEALSARQIDGLVTAPLHKSNVLSADFNYTGHTPYLKTFFNAKDVVMLMIAENMRVGLVTEHLPIAEAAKYITKDAIISKLRLIQESLVKDFGVDKPKIAVLGLNPHAGDEGTIGKEEEEIIKPAIKEFKQRANNVIVFGPYSADAFFARGQYQQFDAVLAMYHDQGLIPFKSLAFGEGVNYTAGLPVVRTSPDHGTAFDIAGKNKADHASFVAAIYACVDVIRNRADHAERTADPMKKVTARLLANAVDEKIEEQEG